MRGSSLGFIAMLVLPAVLLAAACSSNNNKSTTNTNAGGASAPLATVGAGVTASAGSPIPAGAQLLTELMTDNKYSQPKVTIRAGQPAAMRISNNGSSVHNWHVLGVQDPQNKDIKSSLLDPGKSETFTFTIGKPGTYKVQCDVHPAEMTGTITVQ